MNDVKTVYQMMNIGNIFKRGFKIEPSLKFKATYRFVKWGKKQRISFGRLISGIQPSDDFESLFLSTSMH